MNTWPKHMINDLDQLYSQHTVVGTKGKLKFWNELNPNTFFSKELTDEGYIGAFEHEYLSNLYPGEFEYY